MSSNALYTDLSGYYDLMCADIDYLGQSSGVRRLHQIFGNEGESHLDLACGTGPHVRHFIDFGYKSLGLDINQPMLDRAMHRCPEAQFVLQDMCNFKFEGQFDLITCFLYSIHYNDARDKIRGCISSVYDALKKDGVFCFNTVDKDKIDNKSFVRHTAKHEGSQFVFSSGWNYRGHGEKQSLKLRIDKTTSDVVESWQDEHSMVALSIDELQNLLRPYFEIHIFEHDYDRIIPWNKKSGNALFACVKR